jgi:peptidoglycan-N-acetylglucosamine deacetylase
MPSLYSAGVAQGRTRAARPTRGKGPGKAAGRGMPWGWLGVLVLIGAAVFAARTLKLPLSDEARPALPTNAVEAVRAPTTAAPVAVPSTPKPTLHATPVPVAAALTRTLAPARVPTSVANSTHTVAPTGGAAAGGITTTPSAAAGAAARGGTAAPVAGTTTPERSNVSVAGTPGGAAHGVASPAAGAGSGAVMLTFDAGADRGYAEDILDLLQQEHVVASFGVTGQWAKANPELVKRMAADGHMVFNHTLDHRSFTGVSDDRGGLSAAHRRQELDDADAILGHSTQPWYRLPYGDDDAHVAADVQPAGYTHKIGWTVDSLGWRAASSTDIVARCLKLAAPGAVFAMHVGRASQDAIALPQVIHGLRDRGFSFKRVDQS